MDTGKNLVCKKKKRRRIFPRLFKAVNTVNILAENKLVFRQLRALSAFWVKLVFELSDTTLMH